MWVGWLASQVIPSVPCLVLVFFFPAFARPYMVVSDVARGLICKDAKPVAVAVPLLLSAGGTPKPLT